MGSEITDTQIEELKQNQSKHVLENCKGPSQEEVLHDVVVVCTAAVGQVTGRENNDGIKPLAIIT